MKRVIYIVTQYAEGLTPFSKAFWSEEEANEWVANENARNYTEHNLKYSISKQEI